MSEKKRNLPMDWSPKVEAHSYSHKITVSTGCYRGHTRYQFSGDLSIECATNFIRALRRALRAIRAESTERLQRAVEDAEGEV